MTIAVAVLGAAGRMGVEVCRAVADAPDLELVAAVDPARAGEPVRDVVGVDTNVTVSTAIDAVGDAGAAVAVDFTGPATVGDNLRWLLEHDVHAVVGATGISERDLARAAALAADGEANALVAPNFAIGAVLLMRFAAEAARHLPHAEVVELHHEGKVDAPSGTALRTAELIAQAREVVPAAPAGDDAHPGARGAAYRGLRIHSIRLPGLVAHQEVILGGTGQTLTLRHDSTDRSCFMPGVLLAIREVADVDGLVVGLEHVL